MSNFKRIIVTDAYEALQHHKRTCPVCVKAALNGEKGCQQGLELWRTALDVEWKKLNLRVEVVRENENNDG